MAKWMNVCILTQIPDRRYLHTLLSYLQVWVSGPKSTELGVAAKSLYVSKAQSLCQIGY